MFEKIDLNKKQGSLINSAYNLSSNILGSHDMVKIKITEEVKCIFFLMQIPIYYCNNIN